MPTSHTRQALQQRLRLGVQPDLLPVRAYLGLLELALTNLIDNTLRYAPEADAS